MTRPRLLTAVEPEPADRGLALARAAERVLRAEQLVPAYPCTATDWKPGIGWHTRATHTPGWIIHILDGEAIRVDWHVDSNVPYRVKRLTASAEAIEAAGFVVARSFDDGGRLLCLEVRRAVDRWAEAT